MFRTPSCVRVLGALALAIAGCSDSITPQTTQEKLTLVQDAGNTVRWASHKNADVRYHMARSPAYAVFPKIGKGGFIVAGGYGRGVLYEDGKFSGYCDAQQLTIGAQIGGQEYTEMVFFENAAAVGRFKSGQTVFDAQVAAVAAQSSAAERSEYENGIAVVILDTQGLMAEAAMGRQEFRYIPDTQPKYGQ